MGRRLPELVAVARQFLSDEFDSIKPIEWKDDELSLYVEHCKIELSGYSPLKSKEVLETTPGSREIDISEIEHLIDVSRVEYPVERYPRLFRSFEKQGNIIYMLLSAPPSDKSPVYVYCNKVHTLNNVESTLNPREEVILLDGVMAYAAKGKARQYINKVNVGSTRTYEEIADWAQTKLVLYKNALVGLQEVKQTELRSV